MLKKNSVHFLQLLGTDDIKIKVRGAVKVVIH